MSTYQLRKKDGSLRSPYWHFDFRLRPAGNKSQRFFGSTGQKTKKAADRVEAQYRELAALGRLNCSMTITQACEKYWNEVLINSASADDQITNLEALKTYFGPETLLVGVTSDSIADAAALRARTPVRRYSRKSSTVVPTKKKL